MNMNYGAKWQLQFISKIVFTAESVLSSNNRHTLPATALCDFIVQFDNCKWAFVNDAYLSTCSSFITNV